MAMKLVFATTSPTRKRVFKKEYPSAEFADPRGVDEIMDDRLPVTELVKINALAKARAVAKRLESGLVVGIDTVAYFEGHAIGKPANAKEARKTIAGFAGKWHELVSGIAIINAESGKHAVAVERTRVKFKGLSAHQVDDYVATGEYDGKSGAYAIQEKGGELVEKVEGSRSNVAGAPLEKVRQMIGEFEKAAEGE